MKYGHRYLYLPLAATAMNLLLALCFLIFHRAAAQPVVPERLVDRCVGLDGENCLFDFEGHADEEAFVSDASFGSLHEQLDERDPMLFKMPDYDFEAYVRADVSTFYGEEPGSRQEFVPSFNGQACKFINMSPEKVGVYWIDNDGRPSAQGSIGPFSAGGTGCFPDHNFIFTQPKNPDQVLCRIHVNPDTSVYFCDPFISNDYENPSQGEWVGDPMKLTQLSSENRDWYDAHVLNLKFGADYKEFTGGSEWLSMYPRNPPRHRIWRADYFGQTHEVSTNQTHFVTVPTTELHSLSASDMQTGGGSLDLHREPGVLNLTLKALSCAPRAFEIRNFLSDAEVDHLLGVVHGRELRRSMTGEGGGGYSDTRTSRTTWIPRHTDPVLDAIFRRAADVLRLDEALLRHRSAEEEARFGLETSNPINEDLQIVHYDVGQEYTAHHDFSYPTIATGLGGDHSTRSINLCMYLNDTPEGGHTSFPRWRNGHTSDGISVKPEKGKAMIFYMTNPDGNLDDLTHHAALPVIEGEKYFANLWIHDPYRL